MGWSKWSCQIFFLQLLILLPLSLEVELQLQEEDSSCQCPKNQPSYPNLAIDQCHHFIHASVEQASSLENERKQSRPEISATRGQQHTLLREQRAASSTCCQQRALQRKRARSSSAQQPARAGSVACARSTRWHRLLAQQTARAASVASSAREFDAFPATRWQVVRCRRCVGGRLASEQWWRFLEMAAGEERKKNMDLGFHGFYH
ncbi:hypothetical protein WN944_024589 [Citrus x changshan-huyou]|uniref:Uncharacterized protein n=1 Tax=Citrus x changshan-huyou TaxID=2935761 RepID=A0AAP0LNU8_9ROSI